MTFFDPVIFPGICLKSLGFVGNMLQKKAPHLLQMGGNVQLVEFRLLFIQGDHVKKMLPEWQVPRLTLIDTNGWKKGILNHRIHILAIDSTLQKIRRSVWNQR